MRALLICLALALAAPAHAEEPLSAHGRQILDGSFGGSWSNARQPGPFQRTPHYALWVQPSWLYFVRAGLGVGAYVGYRFARESTGREGKYWEQMRPRPDDRSFTYQPFSHDLSFGLTAAWELWRRERLSVFVRPYAGLAIAWREIRVRESRRIGVFDPISSPAPITWEGRHDVRPQAGLRVPVVYQLTGSLGLGLGPDFHWQRIDGYDSFSVGFSSWIARSF